MDNEEPRERTKKFALRIIKLAASLPKTPVGNTISYQVVKAGTSVGANYRSACRGRSKAEFNSMLHIVLEEAKETVFWLELIIESNLLLKNKLESISTEANELTAIFTKSYYNAKRNI